MTVVIRQESQKPETTALVTLYTLDLTNLGDSIYYFTANKPDEGEVVWQGHTYVPFDLEADGFEVDGKGSAPQPKIRFSVTNQLISGLINDFNDLIGAKITRCKTYAKFLDGAPAANPTAHFPLDVFRVERKSSENRFSVEFELSSVMDQRGAQIPGRTITAFYCPWRYRVYNGISEFTYHNSDNACPYAGSDYFDVNNEPVTYEFDKCSKTVQGCKARYGENAVLPFGGFPGAARPIIA